jgi:hypothetical protein
MLRVAFALALSLFLLPIGAMNGPAKAGEYDGYGDGYYPRHHHRNVWYSSSCCYRKVVRHSAHYERIYGDGYYRHRSDYSDPYYRSSYYDRPYRSSYYSDSYYSRPYRSYYSDSYYGRPRYSSYCYRDYGYNGYASYADNCHSYPRKIRIDDDRGGWVWGKRRCY